MTLELAPVSISAVSFFFTVCDEPISSTQGASVSRSMVNVNTSHSSFPSAKPRSAGGSAGRSSFPISDSAGCFGPGSAGFADPGFLVANSLFCNAQVCCSCSILAVVCDAVGLGIVVPVLDL